MTQLFYSIASGLNVYRKPAPKLKREKSSCEAICSRSQRALLDCARAYVCWIGLRVSVSLCFVPMCSFVLFAVIGKFISPSTPINVSMIEGEPYLLACPPRMHSYRVYNSWEATVGSRPQGISSNPNYAPRILMDSNGDLLFSYVNRSDFTTFISSGAPWNPLKCKTFNRFGNSEAGPDMYFYVTSSGMRYRRINLIRECLPFLFCG